jgi:hypothetical protein
MSKHRDDPKSPMEIRALWLQTKAGIKPLDETSLNQELEVYWQVSMSQIGFRIQKLRELLKGQSVFESNGASEQLNEVEKEFNLCVEIGRYFFFELPGRINHQETP